MWLPLCVTAFLSASVLTSYGAEADRASLTRSSDPRDGRCQYTFTVAAPATPAGCPPFAAADQMEGVLSRLGLLEALVSRLVGGQRGAGTSRTGSRGDGSEQLLSQGEENQLQRDRQQLLSQGEENQESQLQRDRQQLSGRVQELLSCVEQLAAEAEALRREALRREALRREASPPDQAHRGPSGSTQQGP